MADKRYVPLDTAQEFLYAFGLRERTKLYDRWETDKGFERDSFSLVLGECPRFNNLDWQAAPEDAADELNTAFDSLDLPGRASAVPDSFAMTISLGNAQTVVDFENMDDKFANLLRELAKVLPESLEIRRSKANGQIDAYIFAILPVAIWRELESLDRSLVYEDWVAPSSD